ncbi:yellow fluorescent protein [Neisseria shayeganii 871]|uniref:Yellow fluorescent protein n=1 Tax=Neisseria shayeganii 871 TaxID=1032488 RepID=G4CFR9_9NEIS|nr:yellow fluorescent protein [Neisseria shayeganii 871]
MGVLQRCQVVKETDYSLRLPENKKRLPHMGAAVGGHRPR